MRTKLWFQWAQTHEGKRASRKNDKNMKAKSMENKFWCLTIRFIFISFSSVFFVFFFSLSFVLSFSYFIRFVVGLRFRRSDMTKPESAHFISCKLQNRRKEKRSNGIRLALATDNETLVLIHTSNKVDAGMHSTTFNLLRWFGIEFSAYLHTEMCLSA